MRIECSFNRLGVISGILMMRSQNEWWNLVNDWATRGLWLACNFVYRKYAGLQHGDSNCWCICCKHANRNVV